MVFDFKHDADLWTTFSPGFWQQDIMTFPMEIGLDYLLENNFTHSGRPLFPFNDEKRDATKESAEISVTEMAYGIVGTGVGLFGGLYAAYGTDFDNEAYPRLAGYFHTFGWTAIFTSLFKNTFQRKRPFYDDPDRVRTEGGNLLSDDRKSFVSGHSSQAFAFATYTTMMLYDVTNNPIITATYGLATHVLAGYIGYTRVASHSHDVIDVTAGALLGSAIGFYVSLRTSEAVSKLLSREETHFTIAPDVQLVDKGAGHYDTGVTIHAVYKF